MRCSHAGSCRSPRLRRRPRASRWLAPDRRRRAGRAPSREIIADVRARGDARGARADRALRRLPRSTSSACRPPTIAGRARRGSSPTLRAALEFAARPDRARGTRRSASRRPSRSSAAASDVRELVVPVDRAGCYVPGGRAPLPVVGADDRDPGAGRGCGRGRAVRRRPTATGAVADATLAAAALAGVDEVYRVGGAQAIAALAYGTETIRPVDVIVGPGQRVRRARPSARSPGASGSTATPGRRRSRRRRRRPSTPSSSRPICSRRPSTARAARRC